MTALSDRTRRSSVAGLTSGAHAKGGTERSPMWWMLALVTAFRVASPSTADVAYALLIVYALSGRSHAIRALFMVWLFSMLSPHLAPIASLAAVGRFAVLIAAFVSVTLRHRPLGMSKSSRRLLAATHWLGIFMLLHSLTVSKVPDVSALKSVSWTLTMSTLLLAWACLRPGDRERLSLQIFSMLALVVLVSIPLAFSEVGYSLNGTGFQGIFSHPQSFGCAASLLGGWSIVKVISERKVPFWIVMVGPVSVGCGFISEARTAAFGLILGLSSTLFFTLVRGQRSAGGRFASRINKPVLVFYGAGVVIAALLVAATPSATESIMNFVSKRTEATGAVAAYNASRGRLIDEMQSNITADPMLGIGFGVASNMQDFEIIRDSTFGLPISAVIEKGVLPIALLEELGIVGSAYVVFWFVLVFRQCLGNGPGALSVLLISFFLNLGEATFFSPNGAGLISLILIGWAATAAPSPDGTT